MISLSKSLPAAILAAWLTLGWVSEKSELPHTKTNTTATKIAETNFTRKQVSDKSYVEKAFGIVKEKKRTLQNPGFERPDRFIAYYEEITQGPQGKFYPQNHRQIELAKALQKKYGSDANRLNVSSQQLDWIQRGPGNVGGRTRAIVVDLDADPGGDTWFAGSASGGIWKTTDAGQSWLNLTPDLAFLSTQALAQSISEPDILYAGTGEGWLPGATVINGNGIYKTTDRGQTWTQLSATVNADNDNRFRNVSRIIVHPANSDIVVVSTNAGLFKSIDGGDSWIHVLDTGGAAASQVLFDGENFSTQYACVTAVGLYKSTDAGDSWRLVFEPAVGGFPSGRIEAAIAPTKTDRIAAAIETMTGQQNDIYLSDDAGATWRRLDETMGNFVWMASQGWYNNAMAFHPFDDDTLFYAGIHIYKAGISAETRLGASFTSDTSNTQSFLGFVNFGGDLLLGGGSSDAAPLFQATSTVQVSDYRNVEVRFGPGNTQKAHRFTTVTSGSGYQDYVEVPFTVWDTEANQQLMLSFFDFNTNGVFDLTDPGGGDHQYIFISHIPYDAQNPANTIVAGGPLRDLIYFIWPITPAGVSWEPDSHPQAKIIIDVNFTEIALRNSQQISSFSFDNPQPNNTHVDHHNLTMVPFDPGSNSFRMLNGNDGGVFYSDDGGKTFQATLNQYITTQFYGVDKRPGASEYVGGMQDNGTWQSPPAETASSATDYIFQISGDGFDAVWNGSDGNEWIGGAQGNWFWLVTNAQSGENATFSPIFPHIGNGNGPFLSILANTKSNPELVLTVAPEGVYRSDDFGRNWTLTSIPEPAWGFNSLRTEIVQSLANPQVVWAGSRFNHSTQTQARLHLSSDGGLTFAPVNTQYTEAGRLNSISGLETHPTDEATAYVLHSRFESPKILRTTDFGQTWEDISGFGANDVSDRGFPDVAVYSLLVLPHDPDVIWAGTEIGIFESIDNGQSWAFADNGLPAVAVWQMKAVDDQIVVATHGRGIWSVTIPELPAPPAVTLPPRMTHFAGGGGGRFEVTAEFRAAYDSSFVVVDGAKMMAFGSNTEPFDTTLTLALPVDEPRTARIALHSYKDSQVLKTASRQAELFPLSEPQVTLITTFDEGRDDFILSGLNIDTPTGFQSAVLQSAHPYPAPGQGQGNLTAVLKTPIIIAGRNALLRFDEIAVVEPGRDGSVFGDAEFWDYVIVEGSNDAGVNWTPLVPGYDARVVREWLSAFENGANGTPELFRKREINLLDTFRSDEEVIIRFRLFWDAVTNGWGWAVDNLEIQPNAVSVQETAAIPSHFSLSQNYPNPFNPRTQISYALPAEAEVTLQIFNIVGQEVRALVSAKKQPAGTYTLEWDGKDERLRAVASGVYLYRIQAGDFVRTRKMTLLR